MAGEIRSAATTPAAELPPLIDWIPQVSPELEAPRHLAQMVELLDRAERAPLRAVISTPPQHGKSLTLFHWLARLQHGAEGKRVLYITYSDDFAVAQMRECKPIIQRSGCEFIPGTSLGYHDLRFVNGGSLYATGVGGAITGRPGGLIVVDDPIKDWVAAQSKAIREATHSWLRSSVLTRAHPDTSVIVVQTRWHTDDVGGRLIRDGWERVNLRAISDDGTALWPERRPLEWLEQQRSEAGLGAHIFEALYQGNPIPRGAEVFQSPSYCTLATVPQGRAAIGIDLAYSSRTHADSSVSIALVRSGETYYVADVIRKQVRAPEFAACLRSHATRYPGAPMRWYCSGTERGTADLLGAMGTDDRAGIRIDARTTTQDKYTRAQSVAAAWNSGKILVPSDATWAAAFIDEITSFSGVNDPHDDQVDALAAAYDALASVSDEQRITHGPRRVMDQIMRDDTGTRPSRSRWLRS